MKNKLSLAIGLAAMAAASLAGASTPAKKAALACPVTGIKIASVAKAAGHSTFKGKTYYFCCPLCKPKFDKTPQKYVTNSSHGKYDTM